LIKREKLMFLIALPMILIWLNCASMSSSPPTRSADQYSSAIQKYQQRLKQNHQDTEAYREIGVICYETGKYPLAQKFLTRSYKMDTKDPKTLMYLGLTLEKQNRLKIALQVYRKFNTVSHLSPYRSQMAGRYMLLNRQLIRQEMQQLAAQEATLSGEPPSPKTIAVFPLNYQGDAEKYAYLGKGISEMMITDLAQVKGLTLIERIRMQALIDEMALGQSGMVDESTMPKMGKLLRAGKIIHGNYDIPKKDQIELAAGFWDVVKNEFPPLSSQSDVLNNLFLLEKDMVFSIIDQLGIQLTPEERMKIQRIPTKNIQAFMAYCQGLEMEDRGDFQQAAKFFQQAVELDPNFSQANQKQQEAEVLYAADISADIKYSPTAQPSSPSQPTTKTTTTTTTNLVSNRLNNITTNIGTIFVPGQDSRESAQEASQSGAEILGDLPLPPALPIRR